MADILVSHTNEDFSRVQELVKFLAAQDWTVWWNQEVVPGEAIDMATEDELRLEIENIDLRRLLAQAGIDAAEQRVLERLQRLLLEELHHKVKNTLATAMAIVTQSLRSAQDLEQFISMFLQP